jgi:hypothetical protein
MNANSRLRWNAKLIEVLVSKKFANTFTKAGIKGGKEYKYAPRYHLGEYL